jgi:hypothetical protein
MKHGKIHVHVGPPACCRGYVYVHVYRLRLVLKLCTYNMCL